MVQISEKVKRLSISVGIDVHKEKWVVSIFIGQKFFRSFSMSASVNILVKHLKDNYADHLIQCAYEAGFSGYWIQKRLQKSGIECMVVNAADIPTTDYERRRKTDKLDSKKLAHHLALGNLRGIYIPDEEQLRIRDLVRARISIANDKRRYMCRIRSFLHSHGIEIPKELAQKLWTKRGLGWLVENTAAYLGINHFIEQYLSLRKRELAAAQEIRKYLRTNQVYKQVYEHLLSVPGIGWTSASLLIAELGNMNRFESLDKLASFCGLVPDVRSSADKHKILGISKRANRRLRSTLIESAWINIRHDPSLGQVYAKAVAEGKPKQKAIIKVSRKLLNRVRAVWIKQEKYQVKTA